MKRVIIAIIAGVTLASTEAAAAPVFVGYPPPGGVTLAQSGNAGFGTGDISVPDGSVGRTNTYTGFDPGAGGYSQLWWGLTSLLGPLQSGPAVTTQSLTLNSLVGNEAVYTGANPWTFSTAFGTVSAPVRYELKTFTLGGAPINLLAAGSVPGLTGSLGVVLDVTPYLGTGFKASYVFEAFNGSTWVGVDQYFNGFNTTCTSGCVVKSVNGAFWDEAVSNSAVPEPASLLLLGTGLLVTVRRRSFRRA